MMTVEMYNRRFDPRTSAVPVFDGLAALGVSGREIATALRVSNASVSKWKTGRNIITDENMVFLSLMLGNEIVAAQESHNIGSPFVHIGLAEGKLEEQEQLNSDIPSIAIWKGVRKYRLWWNAEKNSFYYMSKS